MIAVDNIREQIWMLERKLESIHKMRVFILVRGTNSRGGSSRGNYDPGQDSEWIDYHCTLCDKKWRTEE